MIAESECKGTSGLVSHSALQKG